MIRAFACWTLLIAFSANAQENILTLTPGKKYQIYFVSDESLEIQISTERINDPLIVTWGKEKSFLLSDSASIEKLRNDWKGEATNKVYECGYDYILYVVEGDKIVDKISVNESCKQAVCKHGAFDYKAPVIDGVRNKKFGSIERVGFDSVTVGRQLISDLSAFPDILRPEGDNDEWIKYDGAITIETTGEDHEVVQKAIEKKISEKYPHEDFQVQLTGGGPGHFLLFDIYCSSRLGNSLSDFKTWGKWKPLTPTGIILLSTSRGQIEKLLSKYR